MLKKILSFFLSLFAVFTCTTRVAGQAQPELKPDTVYKKILLVPYNPVMYLSDADHDIAEYSQKDISLVRSVFRRSLLQSVTTKLFSICETHPLVPDVTKDEQKDLEMIYGSLNYGMDTVFPVAHPVKDSLQKNLSAGKGGKGILSKKNSSKLKEIQDLTYMNIRLSHPELLKVLAEKYGTDLFVFLNQFEIKTNFHDCLDLAMKIYRRELKVHFSVFDATGKQVYGDVAVVDFPSNSNDVVLITRNNFPKIADYILQSVPKKK